KRLNTAYLLKESFAQLWSYEREGRARRFFDNWQASLKWQRLQPYERFADMIERHWGGIAAFCKPQNKVSLGFVEGLNKKIRVFLSAPSLWPARRRIPPPQSADLRARPTMMPRDYPFELAKSLNIFCHRACNLDHPLRNSR